MSFRSGAFRQKADVRIREVPEMEFCLAYVPERAELYRLNPSAWFVLRACDNRTMNEITEAYHSAMEPVMTKDACAREVRSGLEGLLDMGIIEEVPQSRSKPKRRRA